jgi:hypothetical protein
MAGTHSNCLNVFSGRIVQTERILEVSIYNECTSHRG